MANGIAPAVITVLIHPMLLSRLVWR